MISEEQNDEVAEHDNPFSGPEWNIPVSHIGDRLKRRVMANDVSRRLLSDAVEIVSCSSLTCDIDIAPGHKGRFAGTLRIRAEVVQNCVVTLETFAVCIEETVTATFWPHRQIDAWNEGRGPEAEIDDATPDPEPIDNDKLDIGSLIFEALVMAVNPYPRKPTALLERTSTQTEEERRAERPFAALEQLRGAKSD
jgi:uncharacterized metal-binding protein YceD (DUF177 family)